MSETRRPDEFYIQALRRLVRRVEMKQPSYVPGLTGVVAGETAVANADDGRSYRGYPLAALVRDASFLEVTYLLLHGELPGQEEFADFSSILMDSDAIDPGMEQVLDGLPLHVSGSSMLRTAVSALGNVDPLADDMSTDASLAKAARLMAQLPTVIVSGIRNHSTRTAPVNHPSLTYTANLLYRMQAAEPGELAERSLDAALIVNSEQGFDTSTFAARVVASAGGDIHAALTTAVGTLNTDDNTAPSPTMLEMLNDLAQADSVEACCQQWMAHKRKFPGFDEAPHPGTAQRVEILNAFCKQLAEQSGFNALERRVSELEQCLANRLRIQPHLGWPTTRLFHYLGLDPAWMRPLYVLSRLPGWSAHIVEQAQCDCPIQPEAHYVGPEQRNFTDLSRRS